MTGVYYTSSHTMRHILVGGIPTPLKKYEFVSWDHEISNIWKALKFHGSKPPTCITMILMHLTNSNRPVADLEAASAEQRTREQT